MAPSVNTVSSGPSVLGTLSFGSRSVVTVLINHDEPSVEHRGNGVLSLDSLSLLGCEQSHLFLEAVDGLELVLDGLLLGKGSSLSIDDLLLGPSSGGGCFHPKRVEE